VGIVTIVFKGNVAVNAYHVALQDQVMGNNPISGAAATVLLLLYYMSIVLQGHRTVY
jgi:hypothetical protein